MNRIFKTDQTDKMEARKYTKFPICIKIVLKDRDKHQNAQTHNHGLWLGKGVGADYCIF